MADFADLEQRTGSPKQVYLAVLHGLEIRRGDFAWSDPDLMKSRDVIDTVVGAIDRAVGRVDGVRLEHKGIVEDIEARICRPAWCVLFADDVTDEDAFEAMRTNLCVAVLAAIKESVSAPRAAASRSGGALETSR